MKKRKRTNQSNSTEGGTTVDEPMKQAKEFTLEQFCRDFLEKALQEKYVRFSSERFTTKDPQGLSAGDLVELAQFVRAWWPTGTFRVETVDHAPTPMDPN